MMLALCHFINTILSYYYIDCMFLNYLADISLFNLAYLYFISYVIKLCNYYRMFLHYCLIMDVINIYDYYIGILLDNLELL